MDLPPQDAHGALDDIASRALARLRDADPDAATRLAQGQVAERLRALAVASDFALDTLVRQPGLLGRLVDDPGAMPSAPDPAMPSPEWPSALRRWRAAASTRLVWRDLAGADAVTDTLAGSTAIAESALRAGLAHLEPGMVERHGTLRDGAGAPQRLVVFGLGKLGGAELNFSSDIDLVYGFASPGESDGRRALAAEDWCARLGQQLARLLDERTAEGFSHRVDLRLRPFGSAGRVALSFTAMEQYFQREGRDWERYAWQKARPVAGDISAGEAFLGELRPFVYRRYLDYGALDGLRAMKAAIAAEVARQDLADDIKRGPGGIREIEFLVQALQLIRGGREPALRVRGLLPALSALVEAGHVEPAVGRALANAYRHLRRLENRLQMLRDAQVHALPDDPLDRARIARGLGYADWTQLVGELDQHRGRVAEEFGSLLAPPAGTGAARAPDALTGYWKALPDAGEAATLAEAGFDQPGAADAALRDFARTSGVRDLSDAARARLDRVLPALLGAAVASGRPDVALDRLLPLLHNVLRRTSYLALLDEQPEALARVVDTFARSGFLGERLAAHPLLLDELLDVRVGGPLPDRAALRDACDAARAHDDIEPALLALNEKRQALSFRIALALLDGRLSPQAAARSLAWLADAVVDIVLSLAWREMERAHGVLPGARFAVLGYGSLGGEELGFGSDLDLVFLHDAPAGAQSDGRRPLDASRWAVRLAQKLVALLGTNTGGGRLYDVDVRLRPDGAKGLLVSSLDSFTDYQRTRAWTWEHQALVRARAVAGHAGLCQSFESVRAATLSTPRDGDALRDDIVAMRARMRRELDRSGRGGDGRFDLKQGAGGLVDLEFLMQALVLRDAAASPALVPPRDTPGLLEAACGAGALAPSHCEALAGAHATLLDAGLRCTLDRRSRVLAATPEIEAARAAIRAACSDAGFDFDATAGSGGQALPEFPGDPGGLA
ncbi:bifunctional [glutamate--ammonia ligase]-adenylyl-L-tyrosine phosphorylase/[glutamate--ammonia-ligase] adenylyltransferase [Luteimonas pelagia]